MAEVESIIGKRFGKLIVIDEFRSEIAQPISGRKLLLAKAKCECGTEIITARKRLIDGQRIHCGCSRRPRRVQNEWMIGRRYSKLTVIAVSEANPKHVECRCDCGNNHVCRAIAVRGGSVKSCGCLRGTALRGRRVSNPNRLAYYAKMKQDACDSAASIVGRTFGRLSILRASTSEPGAVVARCECGAFWHGRASTVMAGAVKSCGCLNREMTVARNYRHGLSHTPEYEVWRSMLKRCLNPRAAGFDNYGGRGILVCSRWIDGEDGKSGLECFVADIGKRPTPQHSIHRIDNDGNYEPANCTWATRSQQARFQRPGFRFGDPLRTAVRGRPSFEAGLSKRRRRTIVTDRTAPSL
jgi:hypothetical protein